MKKHHPSVNMRHGLVLFLFVLVSTFTSWGQITVTGTVVDETQVPVPGANVVIKGESTTGTYPFLLSVDNRIVALWSLVCPSEK